MVACQLPKLIARVRFPLPAPTASTCSSHWLLRPDFGLKGATSSATQDQWKDSSQIAAGVPSRSDADCCAFFDPHK